MKLMKFLMTTLIVSLLTGGVYLYYFKNNRETLPHFLKQVNLEKKYIIKKAGVITESADTKEEALALAKNIKRSIVINTYNDEWIYADMYPFMIFKEDYIHDFSSFREALTYAKTNGYKEIYYKNNKNVIWRIDDKLHSQLPLEVKLIHQYPELPRGCEVTSLAMLLDYRGIKVDKMELARKIDKDRTAYYKDQNGRITYGNPYDGFVGDMYNLSNRGYGVYHEPIVKLAKIYAGDQVVDLTGLTFEEILHMVQYKNPVWVITNSTYNTLQDEEFTIWHTPTGIVKITYKLHCVVMTGFDDKYVYINDPLRSNKPIRLNRKQFKNAWEQMGNQAITILKK